MPPSPSNLICVYAASSRSCHAEYHDAARRLGHHLASRNLAIIYGGGGAGSMGALADGALRNGGRVIGILPRFMNDLEWGHRGLTELHLVDDMHARKRHMLASSDAVVALPGGSGTLEELLEAMTLKRLGLYVGPIVLVNTRGFFNPLLHLLARAIEERFMNDQHGQMWQVVNEPEEVTDAFVRAPCWSSQAREFATL